MWARALGRKTRIRLVVGNPRWFPCCRGCAWAAATTTTQSRRGQHAAAPPNQVTGAVIHAGALIPPSGGVVVKNGTVSALASVRKCGYILTTLALVLVIGGCGHTKPPTLISADPSTVSAPPSDPRSQLAGLV